MLNWQIENNLHYQFQNIKLSEQDVKREIQTLYSDRSIKKIHLEDENGNLMYDVFFDDSPEIKIDAINGKIVNDKTVPENFIDQFTSDTRDTLWAIDTIILLLSSFLSYFLAGKTLASIAEKMRQQKQFISDASHELRNPLSAIKASADSLLRAKSISDEEAREVLHAINEESDRLITLTEDLLLLDQSQKDDAVQQVNAKEIVIAMLKTIEPLAKEKKIYFQTNLEKFELLAKQKDLEKVLFNLLHNAVKFSREDSKIIVKISKNGYFRVKDFGVGITPEDLPYIFDRFYKAENARSFSGESGSGLGLSIIKTLTDKYVWTLDVNSKEGKGTQVTVYF
ncbi:HAMP domain-containing histidine kinase [Candidatus Peregrinibacteria bacterium]|nr:MAG: HAMP domain-containing histidine kinase [Candidatus Peregrinibacteria bacterium]